MWPRWFSPRGRGRSSPQRFQNLRQQALGLLQEAGARWKRLSPEERRRLLSLLMTLLSLLPWGRLGRLGRLLERAAGPGTQVLWALLRFLRR